MKQRSRLTLSPRDRGGKKPPPGFAFEASNDDEMKANAEEVSQVRSPAAEAAADIPAAMDVKKLVKIVAVVAVSTLTLYLLKRRFM